MKIKIVERKACIVNYLFNVYSFLYNALSIWINVSIYVRYEGACHLLLDFGIWVFAIMHIVLCVVWRS